MLDEQFASHAGALQEATSKISKEDYVKLEEQLEDAKGEKQRLAEILTLRTQDVTRFTEHLKQQKEPNKESSQPVRQTRVSALL